MHIHIYIHSIALVCVYVWEFVQEYPFKAFQQSSQHFSYNILTFLAYVCALQSIAPKCMLHTNTHCITIATNFMPLTCNPLWRSCVYFHFSSNWSKIAGNFAHIHTHNSYKSNQLLTRVIYTKMPTLASVCVLRIFIPPKRLLVIVVPYFGFRLFLYCFSCAFVREVAGVILYVFLYIARVVTNTLSQTFVCMYMSSCTYFIK